MKKAALLIIASVFIWTTANASDIAERLRDNPDGALNGSIVFAGIVTGFLIDEDLPAAAAAVVAFNGAEARAAVDEHITSNGGTALTAQEAQDVADMKTCYTSLGAVERAIYRDILPHYTWLLQQVNEAPEWAAIMSVSKWDSIFIGCGQQTAEAGESSLGGEVALIEQTALDAAAGVTEVQEDTEKVNRKAGLALSRAERALKANEEQDAAIAQIMQEIAAMATVEVVEVP